MSIRWKLGIIFLLISLTPLALFSAVSSNRAQEVLKHEIGLNFELVAREKALEIASILNRRVDETLLLAQNPKVIAAVLEANSAYLSVDDDVARAEIMRIDRAWIEAKGDTPMANAVRNNATAALFREFQSHDPLEYGEIFMTDRLGGTIAMSGMLTDYFQADEGWWRSGFKGGKGNTYLDDRGMDRSVNAVVVGVVAPVMVGGKAVGVLKINYKMSHIPAIISNPYKSDDVSVFMLRSNGKAVINPTSGVHDVASKAEAQIIADMSDRGWHEDFHGGASTVMGYARVIAHEAVYSRFALDVSQKGVSGETWGATQWYVFVERNLETAYAPIEKLTTLYLFGGLIIAAIVLFLTVLMATSVTTPLLQLRENMEAISKGNLDLKVGSDRKDEIGQVLRGIDDMVSRLKHTLASRDELNDEIRLRKSVEVALRNRSIELEHATVEAERASKAKSEFLASMSHELRTPLNAVLGFAQMLQFNPKVPLLSGQNEHVESIITGGNHLLELINEILDLARIEADQLDLTVEKVEASEVIADCVALTAPLGEDRKITIVNQLSGGASVTIRTDQLRFKQAMLNLLSNAIKYNKDGGTITVEGRITDDKFLHISVQDTGSGIAEEDRERVFHMFQRLGVDPLITQEGTGIGLTVTKRIIERMAGRIGFDSEKDVGSTFWVELPLTTNETALIWTDALRIGVDAIDKDHQTIVELLNKVSGRRVDDAGLDGVIHELVDYTVYHFKREEMVMKICDYPDLEAHSAKHRDLCDRVGELTRAWTDKRDQETFEQLNTFLRNWLFDHILKVDSTIAPYAHGRERMIKAELDKAK